MNRLLPFLLRFETVAEPGPVAPAAPAPEPVAPAPAPEPAAAAAAPPEPEPQPEPFAVSREDWEATQQALGQIGGFLESQFRPEPELGHGEPQAQPPDPDLLYTDPAAYQQQLIAYTEARYGAMLEERLGALAPMVERPFMQSVEEEIRAGYDGLPDELRAVPEDARGRHFDVLQDIGATLLPQHNHDLAATLQAGAQKLAPLLDAVRKDAVEQYKAELQRAAGGGPQEPVVRGGAISATPPAGSYAEIAARYRATNGVTGSNTT